jgi:hypothetical protein
MHEVTSSHWRELEGTKSAGYRAWNRPTQMDPSLYVDPLKT